MAASARSGLFSGRDFDPEARPRADGGIDADTAAELFGDVLADRQPEPGALREGVDLVEPVENLGAFLLGDADARIADVEPYPSGALREPDRYLTFCREFHGIAYEIAEYLVQSLLVILELEPGQAVFQPQDDPFGDLQAECLGHLAA